MESIKKITGTEYCWVRASLLKIATLPKIKAFLDKYAIYPEDWDIRETMEAAEDQMADCGTTFWELDKYDSTDNQYHRLQFEPEDFIWNKEHFSAIFGNKRNFDSFQGEEVKE